MLQFLPFFMLSSVIISAQELKTCRTVSYGGRRNFASIMEISTKSLKPPPMEIARLVTPEYQMETVVQLIR